MDSHDLFQFIFSFCCSASNNVVEYYMPTYFQVVREYPPAKSGYMMIPIVGAHPVQGPPNAND